MLGMTTKIHKRTLLIFVTLLVVLIGCSQQAPITVYVTPTPVAPIGSVLNPTTQVSSTPFPTVGALPTNTEAGQSPPTQAQPTQPAPTQPEQAGPQPTFLGPIIGPEYTLPPTSTQRPTATPTQGPTVTPLPPGVTPPPTGEVPATVPNLDGSRMGIQLGP